MQAEKIEFFDRFSPRGRPTMRFLPPNANANGFFHKNARVSRAVAFHFGCFDDDPVHCPVDEFLCFADDAFHLTSTRRMRKTRFLPPPPKAHFPLPVTITYSARHIHNY